MKKGFMKFKMIALGACVLLSFSSCNKVMPLFMIGTGVMMPKYKGTEQSMEYFCEKTGYAPEFFAYAATEEDWSELMNRVMFPHEAFYNAYGQHITYDSTKRCAGLAAKFAASLGSPETEADILLNESIEDLVVLLDFAPEMVFDPVELGAAYDNAIFIFFYTGMGSYLNKIMKMEVDSALSNEHSRLAVIPVCMDANKSVFESRRVFKKTLLSSD